MVTEGATARYATSDGDGGYVPGVCNIGPAEVTRRRRLGHVALAASVATGAALLALDAPRAARLLVAAPLAGAALNYLQARWRFCAGFAVLGRHNFGALGEYEPVAGELWRADVRTALRLAATSAAIGLAGGALFALLPL